MDWNFDMICAKKRQKNGPNTVSFRIRADKFLQSDIASL